MPRASIVILSHRATLLPEAFASAHAQDYGDFEIVVKYSHGAWWNDKINAAVRGSSGDYFAILCDDDTLKPGFLSATMAEAERTHADIVYTNHNVLHQLLPPLHWKLPEFSLETLRLHCVPHFTALTSRAIFEKVGGYDGAMKHTDWDFWMRCAKAGATAAHVDGYLWNWRAGAQNSSSLDEFRGDAHIAQLRERHPEIVAHDHGRVKIAEQVG